jgi:acyl carrier protein
MIPSVFVFLAELPLTDNGKVDRKALLKLPTPGLNAAEPLDSGKQPATEIERTVAAAWKDALGLPVVGLHDNFFDLGAHSLTVAEVHARLQDVLRYEFDLIDLYQYTTVSALAAHLAGVQTHSHASNRAQRRRMAVQNRVL